MIVGGIVSSMVITASQESEFPAASKTVNVTLLSPIFSQVKLLIFNSSEVIPMSSVEPPSTEAAVTVRTPFSSRPKVIF